MYISVPFGDRNYWSSLQICLVELKAILFGPAFLASTILWILDFATDLEVTLETANCTYDHPAGKERLPAVHVTI
jgi:hypothetical protein